MEEVSTLNDYPSSESIDMYNSYAEVDSNEKVVVVVIVIVIVIVCLFVCLFIVEAG